MGILMVLRLADSSMPASFSASITRPLASPFLPIVDDAAAFKAGRILGEEAIGIDGEGNRSANFFRPDIVVVGTMAGSSMDKARTCIISDMIAIEERNCESHSPCRSSG